MSTVLTDTTLSSHLTDVLYWTFLALLLLNILQRKHQKKAHRKRFATLYLALGVFALLMVSQLIFIYDGGDWMLLPGFGAVVLVLYHYRSKTFPFRLRSPIDGRRLTWDEIMYDDNHGDDHHRDDVSADNHES